MISLALPSLTASFPASLADFSLEDVCRWVSSMSIDPKPFRENSVEGADLADLTDEEIEEHLKLTKLQIKKLRKRIETYGEEAAAAPARPAPAAAAAAPSEQGFYSGAAQLPSYAAGIFDNETGDNRSMFQKYQNALGDNSQQVAPSSGFGGHDARQYPDSFNNGAPQRLPPPADARPAVRGLAKVVASDGDDLAPPDDEVEKELFAGSNTGIDFDLYDKIRTEATGNNVPEPVETFAAANLHPSLMANIALTKFTKPTPIQRHGLAVGTTGRDMMACAQTGSGKTAAFLFPILHSLLARGPTRQDLAIEEGSPFPKVYPEAVIIAPTRELACQIFDEARKFAYRTFIRPFVIYGGASRMEQLREMQRYGCHILIATPGRLHDFYEARKIGLRKVKFLVLDEADRMLDMGFEPQVRKLVGETDLPADRQTMMFSATFPMDIQRLAAEFLRDYIFVTVGRVGSTNSNILQRVEYVEESDKHERLVELLREQENKGLSLIFVQTKLEADTLEHFLTKHGLPATSIHGDRQQYEREQALDDFRSGLKPVLVATDVASRGLDIPDVTLVINFDMPAHVDDYVHRIGRTGRVGRRGVAVSFFNDQDTSLADDIVVLLKEVNQTVPDWLAACATEQKVTRARYKFGGRDVRTQQRGGNAGGYSAGAAAPAGGDEAW